MADYNDLNLIVLFDGDLAKFETAGDDGKIPKEVYKGRLVLITGNTPNTSNSAKKPQIYASDENGKGKYIPIPYSYVVGLKAGNCTLANIDKLIEFVGANGISVFVNEDEKIQIDGGGIKDQAIEGITPLLANKADLVNGKIPVGQLPDYILGQMLFGGTIEGGTVTQMTVMPTANLLDKIGKTAADLTNEQLTIKNTSYETYEGVYFISSINFGNTNVLNIPDVRIGDWIISTGTRWRKVDNTDAVASVAGLTGVITASALAEKLAASDNINELALKSEVDEKYSLPDDGIPETDLKDSVVTKLNKGYSSVQEVSGGDFISVSDTSGQTNNKSYKVSAKTKTMETAKEDILLNGEDALATAHDVYKFIKARLSVKVVS